MDLYETHPIDRPLSICAAITGGAPAKSRTPHHPVSFEELVSEAVASWNAGAAMIHLHARDETGRPTMSVNAYDRLCDAIRAEGCDAVLNVSAGDNGGTAPHAERLDVATTRSDVISFGAGSFNIGGRLYNNEPAYIREMAAKLIANAKLPEIEIFDTGQLYTLLQLVDEGLIPSSASLQIVFGLPGGMAANPSVLDALLEELPEECHWSICCQSDDFAVWRGMMLHAFMRGGHVRTGMEDVIFLKPGELARSNAELVEVWAKTAELWGRPIMSPAELKSELGIDAASGEKAAPGKS